MSIDMTRLVCSIVAIYLAVSVSDIPWARAQFFTGPSASGAGGAGRAAIDPGESAFLNPASIALIRRYNVSAYYDLGTHPDDGEHHLWGLSFADGSPGNIVAGAVTYVRKKTDQPNGASNTQQDLQIALAGSPFERLSFGLTGHRFSDQLSHPTPQGGEFNQWNAHFGFLFVPYENFGVGFVAYDFLPTDDSIPVNMRLVPTHALGLNYVYDKWFRARFDLVRPDTMNEDRRINVMTGFETFLYESFAVRLGGKWEETADRTYVTAGFGYFGPRLSFDYSFQKDVRTGGNDRHLIDLWITL